MPIVRGASMMSLGTWTARSTKYQKFLNISNVFLLIVSTILLFSSGILMTFYHLTKLHYWSWYFYACPICMLVLGVYTFAVCVYGFIISAYENRLLISLMAVFLSLAFCVQLFSVFTAMELKYKIDTERIPGQQLDKHMRQYRNESEPWIRREWDELQTNLRCCGGMHYEVGFQDWSNMLCEEPNSANTRGCNDVPDSCCHKPDDVGCGRDKLGERNSIVALTDIGIWKDGCLEVLQQKMKDEVVPMLNVYTGVGVLLAIVELITVAIACAYVAQINRRRRRSDMYSRAATANDEEYLPSLTSKETNF